MNIFVTGATGYIGSAVTDALLKAGHSVTGLARSDKSAQTLEAKGVSVVRGELTDTDVLAQAASAADAVIHTASANDATSSQTDPNAIASMLDALEGTNKTLIYTAGLWDMGDGGDTILTEETPDNPIVLTGWRPAVSHLVLDSAHRGVRGVVIRPGIVYGHGGGMPAMFVQSARDGGAAQYVGDGENFWTYVNIDDLADLYVRALDAPAGTLLLGVVELLKVKEVAAAASRGAGANGATTSWPLAAAQTAMGPFADALALNQKASGAKARELLGWSPIAPSVLEDLEHGSYVSK